MVKQPASKEMAKYEAKEQLRKAKFSATQGAVQALDLTKSETRTFTVFNKEKLRTYMQNPKANENNLRSLARFLYRVSFHFRRICNYYAEMIELDHYVAIPNFSFSDTPDSQSVLSEYEETLLYMRKMNLKSQLTKLFITAWREDSAYGYVYEDDDEFFILPLDGEYCKISSTNYDGSFNFAFDFSFFRSNAVYLEYWDKEFTTKYNAYVSDPSLRWQELDPTRTICLKINIDDERLSLSPFIPLFEQIIDLIDLQSIQAVKEELSVYKLLVAEIETLTGAQEADDFAVDLDTAILFYNRLVESLPENVSSCISPVKITPIEFKGTTTEEADMLSNSMSNLFNSAGTAQILDSKNISGSTAFEASILCDSLMATKILLPQVEVWVNRRLKEAVGDTHARIKYIEVTPYTKSKKIAEVKEAATYGVPNKLMYANLLGLDPLDTLSLEFLENTCLSLHDKFVPLQSSHTQGNSGSGVGSDVDPAQGGAPTQDGVTEEGEKSRNRRS